MPRRVDNYRGPGHVAGNGNASRVQLWRTVEGEADSIASHVHGLHVIGPTQRIESPWGIHLRKGGYAYSIDQGENPELARFKPSGQFAEGILVAGSIDTYSRISYSGLLFQALVKLLKQRSRRIGSFWVGREAEEKLRLGWRLVTSVSSPREYDLALE